MDLSPLLQYLESLPGFIKLLEQIGDRNFQRQSLGLPRAVRPLLATSLARKSGRTVLYIVPRTDRLLTLSDELQAWISNTPLISIPEPNPSYYEPAAWNPLTRLQRVNALGLLSEDRQPGTPQDAHTHTSGIFLATARSIMTRSIAPRTFLSNSRWLKIGSIIQIDALLRLLIDTGYEYSSVVTEPGQITRRGGIVDIWPASQQYPVRVELFGDEIDSMRSFDPSSQRSTEATSAVRITPAREGLPKLYQEAWGKHLETNDDPEQPRPYEFFLPRMDSSAAGVLSYLPKDALVLVEDRAALENAVAETEEHALAQRAEQIKEKTIPEDFPTPYLTLDDLQDQFSQKSWLDLGQYSLDELENEWNLPEAFSPGPRFGGQLKPLLEHLTNRIIMHEPVIVVSRQASRLAELANELGRSNKVLEDLPAQIHQGDLHFVQGALSEGWVMKVPDSSKIHLLTDAEIFGWSRPRPRMRPRLRASAPESAYADLTLGDIVVHIDYGIGRFEGLVERTLEDIKREYLLIEFANGDQVYVPIHQADRITRYVGSDGSFPTLSRLGTQEWERAKTKVKAAAEDVARDLLALYSDRMTVKGHSFAPDGAWQQELEASFPYIETVDQLAALEAVKGDMERSRPMDRLICGDVGYGKTEVALRAAFKAVMDGKQVAMLVPTTVLAQQHFNTFLKRLAAYPFELEMLSRFRTRGESQEIIEKLELGDIDIVIGTHRLLQQDIKFKDLGLLIIDEEQRFGVTHKEFLKRMRTEVDVLTLTATPIPRTLYMALTGARDISTINTPPEERQPVATHVGPYDPRLVRQAVLRELDRGGQVFFVHNRVQTIRSMESRLQRLLPEARIAIGHGQMPENRLSEVMEQFNQGEIDILISTSIIESGLDIPNANTLIVDRADMFGLAQLYQLRGRVGRGAAQAYAYFFRHPSHRISTVAFQRLEVIAENTQLGSGYTIAMRDLEIRGAGDILGIRQHGHIAEVGFHLYTQILATAVQQNKIKLGSSFPTDSSLTQASLPVQVTIDLPLPSAIPEEFISDRSLRLQLYRRLAQMRSNEQFEQLILELEDRFGHLPSEIRNLIYQLKVRMLASEADVETVSTENGQVLLVLSNSWDRDQLPELGRNIRVSKRGIWMKQVANVEWTKQLIELLEKLRGRKKQLA
jgi:transcription-repair coupling factor (superfamily II helicase)